MSHVEPLVKRAVDAASALIEALHDPSQNLRHDFYHNYNRVIRSITDPSQSHSIESLMTACGLFACFELCLGSIEGAVVHVRSGVQISKDRLQHLAEEGRSHIAQARFLMEHALPLLAGFALQARVYGFDILTVDEIAEFSDEKYSLPQVPSVFPSPQQAHHCLGGIIHHFALFESSVGCGWDWQLIRVLGGLLVNWTVALDNYEGQLSKSQQEQQRPSLGILRCNQHLAVCLMKGLTLCPDATNPTLDRFSADLGQILIQYKTYGISESLQTGKVTSSELEVLPLLFIVAIGTPRHEVRDEALQIMTDLRRKEVNWSSREAVRVAKIIIEHSQKRQLGLGDLEHQPVCLPTCLHVASLQWVSPDTQILSKCWS